MLYSMEKSLKVSNGSLTNKVKFIQLSMVCLGNKYTKKKVLMATL